MFDFGLGEWHEAPVFLPSLIVNRSNSLALLLDIFQINRANYDPLLRCPSVSNLFQPRGWLGIFREPPGVPVFFFLEAASSDQTRVISRVVSGEQGWRKFKPVD